MIKKQLPLRVSIIDFLIPVTFLTLTNLLELSISHVPRRFEATLLEFVNSISGENPQALLLLANQEIKKISAQPPLESSVLKNIIFMFMFQQLIQSYKHNHHKSER